MRSFSATLTAVAAFGALGVASPVTFCAPENNGVCYSIAVPEQSASTGQGDIFVQITAPSSMSWVGIAQSPSGMMMGANMLVAYASQNDSSVTLSPRLGTGHTMPHFNKDTQATLLDGSGMADGSFTANIRCANCNSWTGGSMSFADSSSTWIYAYQEASDSKAGAIRSNNVSAPIGIHTGQGSFKVDLTQATSSNSSDNNPFTGQALDSATGGAQVIKYQDPVVEAKLATMKIAHGSVMGIAFGALYPLGAMLMRLHGKSFTWAIHGSIQVLALALSIAGMGTGIYMAWMYNILGSAHAIIGLVTVSLIFFMPFLGWIQHSLFCRYSRRTWWGRIHAYLGRCLMILGLIEVGTGLQLSAPYGGASQQMGMIAFGVLGGIVGLVWLITVAVTAVLRRRKGVAQKGDEGALRDGEDGSTNSPTTVSLTEKVQGKETLA